MLIIGLVGSFGSGKSTVAKYLKEKGFFSVRLSKIIEEEIIKNNLGSIKDRKTLQDVGNNLRKEFGANILMKRALAKAEKEGAKKNVIDGIRNVDEIKYAKKQGKAVYIIGVSADWNVRFKRQKERLDRKVLSTKEFRQLESRDKGKGQRKMGLQVTKCWDLRDYEISNNKSISELKQAVDDLLNSINKNN